ncbi:hypothetical protein [Cryobacterium sp. PH31-O1]|uniref:hypothetical protein n=1 Tax=Cryobacterium sp. PH31-O1 TaxID=3046306 RepID=UPI0024BA250C|nr:hypothetical protein [Cryobacterium sp. PH31-O1]MDJ0338261.1 hypothetical protein [Cryobacterium sp. PH31-O1]
MQPLILSVEDAAGFGRTVTPVALRIASARVREYVGEQRLAAAGNAQTDGFFELVSGIAARLDSQNESLAGGVQQESGGAESVTFGWDSFQGVTDLLSAEKKRLDRSFPQRPTLIVQAAS